METNCPKCSQRLRFADHLVNPTLRCKTCGNTFRVESPVRMAEALPSFPAAATPIPDSVDENLTEFVQANPPSSATEKLSNTSKSGWGTAGVVIFFLLLKGVPKLMKAFNDDRPPPQPVPVQFDAQQRDAIRNAIRKKIADEQQRPAQEQLPEFPQPNHPNGPFQFDPNRP